MSKTIETDCYVNKCECGELNTMKRFVQFEEGGHKADFDVFLAFCCCGNIFVSRIDDGPAIPPRTD